MRFFLNGLEKESDFDIVKRVLTGTFGFETVREIDGMSFRRAELQRDDSVVILYWDDFLGVFLVNLDQAGDNNEVLESLLVQAISLLDRMS